MSFNIEECEFRNSAFDKWPGSKEIVSTKELFPKDLRDTNLSSEEFITKARGSLVSKSYLRETNQVKNQMKTLIENESPDVLAMVLYEMTPFKYPDGEAILFKLIVEHLLDLGYTPEQISSHPELVPLRQILSSMNRDNAYSDLIKFLDENGFKENEETKSSFIDTTIPRRHDPFIAKCTKALKNDPVQFKKLVDEAANEKSSDNLQWALLVLCNADYAFLTSKNFKELVIYLLEKAPTLSLNIASNDTNSLLTPFVGKIFNDENPGTDDQLEILDLLLRKGASPMQKAENEPLPLIFAAKHLKVIQKLFNHPDFTITFEDWELLQENLPRKAVKEFHEWVSTPEVINLCKTKIQKDVESQEISSKELFLKDPDEDDIVIIQKTKFLEQMRNTINSSPNKNDPQIMLQIKNQMNNIPPSVLASVLYTLPSHFSYSEVDVILFKSIINHLLSLNYTPEQINTHPYFSSLREILVSCNTRKKDYSNLITFLDEKGFNKK